MSLTLSWFNGKVFYFFRTMLITELGLIYKIAKGRKRIKAKKEKDGKKKIVQI